MPVRVVFLDDTRNEVLSRIESLASIAFSCPNKLVVQGLSKPEKKSCLSNGRQ
jgi:hypothetical protein